MVVYAPAQIISAPAQLITTPAQPPATGAVVYTALFFFFCSFLVFGFFGFQLDFPFFFASGFHLLEDFEV